MKEMSDSSKKKKESPWQYKEFGKVDSLSKVPIFWKAGKLPEDKTSVCNADSEFHHLIVNIALFLKHFTVS